MRSGYGLRGIGGPKSTTLDLKQNKTKYDWYADECYGFDRHPGPNMVNAGRG